MRAVSDSRTAGGCLLVTALAALAALGQAELYTALVELEELLETEAVLLRTLEGYISAQEEKLSLLRRNVQLPLPITLYIFHSKFHDVIGYYCGTHLSVELLSMWLWSLRHHTDVVRRPTACHEDTRSTFKVTFRRVGEGKIARWLSILRLEAIRHFQDFLLVMVLAPGGFCKTRHFAPSGGPDVTSVEYRSQRWQRNEIPYGRVWHKDNFRCKVPLRGEKRPDWLDVVRGRVNPPREDPSNGCVVGGSECWLAAVQPCDTAWRRNGRTRMHQTAFGPPRRSSSNWGAAVAERLACLPPADANPGSIRGWVTPGYSHVGIMSDDAAGRHRPPPPTFSFRRRFILT
ncbi:hypothetical protein PR048_023772 [Dryococelus australis]|uniref:Uncharacterized protein n=1 Tax=Dryococelus australis TaxID=614101 RepID=A0ABQ9GV04_9NEOP|nr:hypothetical protein PR048_023772 [Dryococelus australis]